MSRAYDYTVATVVTIVAFIWHRLAVGFFDPSGPLFQLAADANNLDGAARAALWMEISTLWVPLLAIGGVWAWVFVNEYKRQVATAVQRRPV